LIEGGPLHPGQRVGTPILQAPFLHGPYHRRPKAFSDAHVLVVPEAAAALAALLSGAFVPPAGARVGVVLCGANTDPGGITQGNAEP
jgi:hypothetical protein